MRLTGKGIWGEPKDVNEAKRVFKLAVELGVNFVDTADGYGPDVSERLIGETLSPFPKRLVVANHGWDDPPRAGPMATGCAARISAATDRDESSAQSCIYPRARTATAY